MAGVYKGLTAHEVYVKRSSRIFRSFFSGKMTFSDLNREMKREGRLDIKAKHNGGANGS